MIRMIRTLGVLALTIIAISACSSGSDGVPPAAPSAQLDGTVTDAVIINGTLRVYAFDNGEQGALIAETLTDANGDFVFDSFTSPDRPIMIEVSSGRYTEEASGVSVDLIQGQVLRAYLFYQQGSEITVQVTPLTHLASCLADNKISNSINVNNAITEATSVFSGLTGVDILGTRPLDITDPNNANFEITDSLRYGTVLAAMSSFTAEVSIINGVTPHRFNQNTSIYATQILCQDIAADGIFNGLGYVNNGNSIGQLSLGSVPLDADTFRSNIAQHILSIISSDRNQTTLGIDDFILYANEVASSTDGIFGGAPATAVDQEGPVSTAVLAPDSYIKGIVDLDFDVTDPIGIQSVQFEVNGLLNSNAQIEQPILSINTTNYTDGVITITVVATDVLNNESRTDFQYVVDNSSPTVALTSPTLVNNRSYTAMGTYQAEGSPIASITVNGVNAAIDTTLNTWTADISLLSGENIVVVQITDTVGNSNSVEADIGVDLIFPTISPNETLVRFTTYQGQLNLCTSGQLTATSGIDNPVCLSTDNISLNGVALDGGLQNLGYILLGFSPTDPQGAGIFTDQDNLLVEYKYELNGTEIIPWSIAPRTVGGSNLFYYFPMVTEYLGNNWYQTTTEDIHKITIRATDEAGNSSDMVYQLRFDILVPEIITNTSITNEAIFTEPTFASRSAIDGQTVNIEYVLENPSNTSYYIYIDDDNNHAVTHDVESGIRENRARVMVSESWSSVNCGNETRWDDPACPGTEILPVNSVTYTAYHNNQNQTITPSAPNYSSYENVYTDNPTVSDMSSIPTITPLANYTCQPGDIRFTNSNDAWKSMATANGNTNFNVCRFFDDEDGGISAPFSALTSTVTQSIQMQNGYPRDNRSITSVNYTMYTESTEVFDNSIGQQILPVNGWYRVPENTNINIIKSVKTPVITHYNDVALASTTDYTQKQYDKSTTWNLDTNIHLTRAIDPGDVTLLASVTQYTETIGLGMQSYNVSR